MLDYVMSLERENRNLRKDEEAVKLFYYLCKHCSYKTYNPKGNYYVITFTIYDENINKSLDEYLNKIR